MTIIKLETPEEDWASDDLQVVVEDALKGEKNCQYYLKQIWDESWSSIKKKLKDREEYGGSIWYVWWMDGVRGHLARKRGAEE